MSEPAPQFRVNWDITYACPLRCGFCYSESGRRKARHLDMPGILRLIDAAISARVCQFAFGGGEPTLVAGLEEAALRLQAASIPRDLYTSGYLIDGPRAERLVRLFSGIYVSVDGATSGTHDRLRGRQGSFKRAMHALKILSDLLSTRRAAGEAAPYLGVEFTAVQSNFSEIAPFSQMINEAFPSVDYITIGAAVPAGLASRPSYTDSELLSSEQLTILRGSELADRIRRTIRGSTAVSTSDSWWLLHPNRREMSDALVQVEPDGGVRAYPTYEGTVGNLLEEPLETIWRRAQARQRDPYVLELLSKVSTMSEWSAAVREMDRRFADSRDLVRITRRQQASA